MQQSNPMSNPLLGQARVKSIVVPDDLLAPMRDSSDVINKPTALRERLAEEGYLFLAGALPRQCVVEARTEVLGHLASVDEISEPTHEAIASGRSKRSADPAERGRFWQRVSEGVALRRLTHGEVMHELMQKIFGEPALAHDYMFLRAGTRGRATGLHFDYPFFGRLHDQVCTVWTPIGDVAIEDGPLVIVEGSHRYRDLIEPMIGFDVANDPSRKADLGTNAIDLATQRGTRLLTRHFRGGDVAIFGLFTAHGSLDNHSPVNRVRLSCDLRWQPASLPVDPRYAWKNPGGTTGAGYAELNGAKPLTEAWHVR